MPARNSTSRKFSALTSKQNANEYNPAGENVADERIEDVSGVGGELTTVAADDLLVILDRSDTTDDLDGTAKRVQAEQFEYSRGHIDGLITSNGTDTDHDIDISAGVAAIDDGTIYKRAILTSTLVKQIDAAWAVGSAAGGLDTGAVAVDTWYHVWLIHRSDTAVTDALFSTSATAPTMPTNYDFKRRIGAVLTDGSSNIMAYRQFGNLFLWDIGVRDFATTNPGTSAVLATLAVPTGVAVLARSTWTFRDTSMAAANNVMTRISGPDQSDTAPATTNSTMRVFAATGDHVSENMIVDVITNTSAQARYRLHVSDAGISMQAVTHGWIDPRGKSV